MKKGILIGLPYHGNLGDSAIAIAEMKFLRDNFKDLELEIIPEVGLKDKVCEIKKKIEKEDIIFLHGGGNIGTYKVPEEGRREVIKEFPENRIIIFPQTVYFEKSESGKEELEISKRIYNGHKNLTIVAREKTSLDFMKEHFKKVNILFTPDIVMYLNEVKYRERENKVLLCFRGDRERKTDERLNSIVKKILADKVEKYEYTDTHLGDKYNLKEKERREIVDEKFEEFRKSKIVITDRLHGMIFAAVTGTPCVAFGNFNHKIKDSFEWIRHLGYVQYVEDNNDYKDIERKINKVLSYEECVYDNTFAIKEYEKIKKWIQGAY